MLLNEVEANELAAAACEEWGTVGTTAAAPRLEDNGGAPWIPKARKSEILDPPRANITLSRSVAVAVVVANAGVIANAVDFADVRTPAVGAPYASYFGAARATVVAAAAALALAIGWGAPEAPLAGNVFTAVSKGSTPEGGAAPTAASGTAIRFPYTSLSGAEPGAAPGTAPGVAPSAAPKVAPSAAPGAAPGIAPGAAPGASSYESYGV